MPKKRYELGSKVWKAAGGCPENFHFTKDLALKNSKYLSVFPQKDTSEKMLPQSQHLKQFHIEISCFIFNS